MTLKEYLIRNPELTQDAFAKSIGTTQASINRWSNGKRFPERHFIIAIERATEGLVKPADWYTAPEITEEGEVV